MRRTLYLTATLLLLSILALAQDTLRKKKFYIGVFASADYTYRTLLNKSSSYVNFIKRERDSTEIPMPSYTLGLDFLYQISKKVALSWGLQYSSKGYQTKPENYTFFIPRRGFVPSAAQTPASGHIKYSINYADIPVRINIYLIKGKIAPFITTGISTNVFLYERNISYITYADGHRSSSSGANFSAYEIRRVNPQFQLGGGFDIAFKKSRVRFLPIARLSFLSDAKGEIKEYLWSLGVGINYLFGI